MFSWRSNLLVFKYNIDIRLEMEQHNARAHTHTRRNRDILMVILNIDCVLEFITWAMSIFVTRLI